jgi:hypothetical protein
VVCEPVNAAGSWIESQMNTATLMAMIVYVTRIGWRALM